jgi:prepilin-type N-terminal cleavage/methylation domain-containing protein
MMYRPTMAKGFTLLEMMVSLVLSVMLLGVLSLVSRNLKNEATFRDRTIDPNVVARAFDLIETDLINAREMRFDGRRLELLGPIERTPMGMQATLRQAWVAYEVRRSPARSILVRAQRSQQRGQWPGGVWTEGVMEGIEYLGIDSDEELPSLPWRDEDILTGTADSQSGRINRMPQSIGVTLGTSRWQLARTFLRENGVP